MKVKTIRLPRVERGKARKFIQCNTCKRVYYYDFIPYSLQNSIPAMDCGHSLGRRLHDCVKEIPEKRARVLLAKYKAKQAIAKAKGE